MSSLASPRSLPPLSSEEPQSRLGHRGRPFWYMLLTNLALGTSSLEEDGHLTKRVGLGKKL